MKFFFLLLLLVMVMSLASVAIAGDPLDANDGPVKFIAGSPTDDFGTFLTWLWQLLC